MSEKIIKVTPEAAEKLARRAAKHIDIEAIVEKVKNLIPAPKDGRNLVLTDALRTDVIKSAALLVPPGKDGAPGTPGAAGENYILTQLDRNEIAAKIRADIQEPNINDVIERAIAEIDNRGLFAGKEQFKKELLALSVKIKSLGRSNAGISGGDMIEEIDKILGAGWHTGGLTAVWGSITGALSSQTDLDAALLWESTGAALQSKISTLDIDAQTGDLLGATAVLSDLTTANGILRNDATGKLSSSVALPDGTRATTQARGDSSTKLATTQYIHNFDPGIIQGLEPRNLNTTQIKIPAGLIMANGKFLVLTADETYTMVSLSGTGHCRYVYINDSATTAPTPVFIDSLTAPIWDYMRNGWYNGDDRFIGAVPNLVASSTIPYFDVLKISERQIRVVFGAFVMPALATAMNPSASWQAPDDHESSEIIPENCNEIDLYMQASDIASYAKVYATSKEFADADANILNAQFSTMALTYVREGWWIILGASRNVRITGEDPDDNALDARCRGWGYPR